MEDKQVILDLLCRTLQATRDQHDLKALIYDEDSEEVMICWEGGNRTVNVALDSGIAMVKDVLTAVRNG